MKRIFSTILTLMAVGAIAYPFREQIQAGVQTIFYIPCARPIAYSIGTLDSRFNVSEEYLLEAISDAVDIWEKPLKKDLFVHQPDKGAMKVNFIFDYRALVTTKLAVIDTTLKVDQFSYDSLKEKYEGMKNQYASLNADYDVRIDSFNKRRDEYEKQVAYWNNHGGVTKETYNQLEAERKALQAETKEIQALQGRINGMVDELNVAVAELNRLAKSLNLNVDKYNEIGDTRGETFEEGLYMREGLSQKIDIYEWSDRNKLVRVLAHELGHALGLDHVLDPEAIMYKVNAGTSEVLTPDDLTALKTQCRIK